MTTIANLGRPTRPHTDGAAAIADQPGRGLLQNEPLIFERGGWDKTGVDFDEAADPAVSDDLAGLTRAAPPRLPGLSEPETLRHYVRLSQLNHAIDLALYPLGSCTMKHNPRLNEKMARLPGFADIHPLQPVSTVQGALALMDQLAHWLKTLTGMPAAMRARPCWRRPPPMAPIPPLRLWPAIRWWRSPRPPTVMSTWRIWPPS